MCLSVAPHDIDRRGPVFALAGGLPALVSLADEASPYFLGGEVAAIFHFGISHLAEWRIAASGAVLGGREGAAGALGGWTGVRLTPRDTPIMFGLGVAGGYVFLPTMLGSDWLPVSSAYVAPYVSPIGAHFERLDTELRISLWLTEQASPTEERFACSFVQASFWVGYGFYE